MKQRNIVFLFSNLLILVLALAGCQSLTKRAMEYSYADFVMDTVFSARLYSEEDYGKEIQQEIQQLEKESLSWREEDSEIAKLNQSICEKKEYEMSSQMKEWMESSLSLAEDSQGAFDPTLGALTKLWNIEGDNPKIPQKSEIVKVLSQIGYEKAKIKENTIYIEETVSFDLGASGKGIACDQVLTFVQAREDIKGAVIAVGGSILTYGKKENGGSWNIAVQDPEGKNGESLGVFHLKGTHFISTSGDYQKYFEQDGKKYHHILDPSTGYPAEQNLSSVTIVCDQGLLSDALSTACYVLGIKESKELLEKYNATAVFVDQSHNVTVVGPLEDCFEILNKNYHKK